MKTKSLVYIVVVAIALIFVITLYNKGCDGNKSKSSYGPKKDATPEWYEGGTLHKATIAEWKNATNKNKLSTCADFMATVDNTVSMSELKIRATNLKNCINEATRGLEATNDMKVSEIAATCTYTMGYK